MEVGKNNYIVNYSRQLLKECLALKEKIFDYSKEKKNKFNAWKSKRERLEAIEDKYNQMDEAEKGWLTNRYIEPTRRLIYQEILKLLPPRKREYASELLNSPRSSHDLNWENLNLVPSSRSLTVGNESHCASCAKSIGFWQFFSKKTDKENNLFCSQKCFDEFHALICDNCQMRIRGTFHYIDEERQRGTLCFLCGTVKCSECLKIMTPPRNYFSGFLPSNGEVKKISSHDHDQQEKTTSSQPLLCKSCQARKIR